MSTCPAGHNLERYGTYPDTNGSRRLYLRCRECNKQRARRYRATWADVKRRASETLAAEIAAARAEAATAPLFRGPF